MSKKQGSAPLKLKRPQNYVIEYPQDYKPPKQKPQKQKRPSKQKVIKTEKTQRLLQRIPRPSIKKPVDEKKKYYLPGQKYPSPDQDDGLRIFYESLLAQKPDSVMALRYCIEHGLLQKDVAEGILQHENRQKLLRKENRNH